MACLTGALWPLQSQHDCRVKGEAPVDPTCLRCEGGHPETLQHRHWSCVGNKFDHPDEAAKQSHRWLSRRAHTDATELPCFWLRGLLPASLTIGILPPPVAEATAMVFCAGGASTEGCLVRNHPLFWNTEGGGGKYGHDERLIRAGWSAVAVSHMVPFPQRAAVWGALYGPLPGEPQGSDRSEVWALLQLLERTLGVFVIGTDCRHFGQIVFAERW